MDPDRDMLTEAKQHAERRGVKNLRWIQSVAENTDDWPSGPLRVVTFGQSFHWTDRESVAEAVYDRLEPGGSIVIVAPDIDARPAPEGPGHPPIPHESIRSLIERVLGSRRRAGQGFAQAPTERHEVSLARTRFGPPRQRHARAPERHTQDIDGVISNYLSTSFCAPHLFGDRLDAFVAELRTLLEAHTQTGRFWDWPGDTSIVIGTKPASA